MASALRIQAASPYTPAAEMSNGRNPALTTGDPGFSLKSRRAGSTNSGSATSPCRSLPFACHSANVLPLKEGAPFAIHQKLSTQLIFPVSFSVAPYFAKTGPWFQ